MISFNDVDLFAIGNTIQIAGVIMQGDGTTLLHFFPDDLDQRTDPTVVAMDLDDWKKLIRQTDLLETEVLTQASDGALAKVILRKSQRQIDTRISWRVYRRDDYTCRYCGNDDTPLTVDHVITWEDGGPTVDENLVACCRKCNKTRGNLPYAEWLNHAYYAKVSRSLKPAVRRANNALVDALARIPRVQHKRSR